MRLLRLLALAVVACALPAGLVAHVRLQTNTGTNYLFWPSPSNVGIVINSAGSADISDGSHETAIRLAIRAWNDASGTTAQLVEDTSPAQQARTDFTSTSIHLVLFDEANSSGYFADPGTVAVTPVWYFASGQVSDADVLFNGQGHQFTTEVPGSPGRFDVQDVATHELGHLLGLDHTGFAGAAMYPYVDPTVILHRSPALDDVHGLRDAYPSGSYARLSGRVLRVADSTPVEGAHVVARTAAGRTAGAALSSATGTFLIKGLEPATSYEVLATPLEGPVTAANLGMGHVVETDFESIVAAGTFAPAAGQTLAVGDILVGADVAVSLGTPGDPFPLRCEAGLTNFFLNAVHGAGLVPGSTLSASDPALTVGNVVWFAGARVDFSIAAPAGAAPGHADLVVVDPSGDVSILPAALEVTPQDPTVTTVVPGIGPDFGGTAVTITGDRFNAGARVVIGPNIHVDGEAGCSVVDASTITLTTAAMPPGTYDVVVIDATGVEGRRTNGFTADADLPGFDSVFPVAGDAAGGTLLTLRGENFQVGLTVRIDGVTQAGVTYHDATRLSVVTSAGAPGGPYDIDVVNPGGDFATRAFTYVAAPDPLIAAVDPTSGGVAGGSTIQIQGANFTGATSVVFGADPDSGLGGMPAASVTFLDASTLEVVTPSMSAGAKSVLVANATGQAGIAPAAFTFLGGGGGGGGGCSVGEPARPADPWQPLASGGWFLLALLLAWWNARRLRRRALLA